MQFDHLHPMFSLPLFFMPNVAPSQVVRHLQTVHLLRRVCTSESLHRTRVCTADSPKKRVHVDLDLNGDAVRHATLADFVTQT